MCVHELRYVRCRGEEARGDGCGGSCRTADVCDNAFHACLKRHHNYYTCEPSDNREARILRTDVRPPPCLPCHSSAFFREHIKKKKKKRLYVMTWCRAACDLYGTVSPRLGIRRSIYRVSRETRERKSGRIARTVPAGVVRDANKTGPSQSQYLTRVARAETRIGERERNDARRGDVPRTP